VHEGVEALVGILMPFVGEVEVDHGGCELGMSQVALDEPGIDTRFEQMGGVGMPTRIVTRLILRRWPRSVTRTIPALDRPWRLSGGYGAKPPTVLWSSSPRAYSGPSPWGGLTLSRAPRCAILPRPPCASMPCWSGAICSIITTPC
jgi:hypothetical protein